MIKVEMSKDIDEFKESVFKGLSLSECLYGIAAILVGVIIVTLIHKKVGLNPAISISILPVSIIALPGFYKSKTKSDMGMLGVIKAFFKRKTKLYYKSTENIEYLEKLESEIEEKKNSEKEHSILATQSKIKKIFSSNRKPKKKRKEKIKL